MAGEVYLVSADQTDEVAEAGIIEENLGEPIRTYFPETWIWELVSVG